MSHLMDVIGATVMLFCLALFVRLWWDHRG